MVQTIEVIYENGMLRPLQPLEEITEHAKLKVTVEVEMTQRHALADCIGIMPDADAEEMRRIIEDEFGKVNLTNYKF